MTETKRFAGKAAIVTGASRGIGAEVARRLAAEGAALLIVYRSDHDAARAVVGAIRAHGGTAHALAADISQPGDCARIMREAMEVLGRIDILVNAAGVASYKPLADADAAHYRALFDTNVLGSLALTREAAAIMETPGRIIHFASRLAETPLPGASVYAASKAAVSALTLALAQELGPRGITINAVAPGPIETDMTTAILRERGAALAAQTPLRRIGQPGDIAGIVAFLASDDAGWITGRTLRADGGLL